ncbi:MAG: hypothetical protein H5T38_05105 [Methanobacteriaceae archaeon]|nr:hypothetical protein [Methanobacteriaceae archaeon]
MAKNFRQPSSPKWDKIFAISNGFSGSLLKYDSILAISLGNKLGIIITKSQKITDTEKETKAGRIIPWIFMKTPLY